MCMQFMCVWVFCVRTSGSFKPVSSDPLLVCVCPKVSVHMNHLSVIGTENHVGQRINRLPGYAEYSLSDLNREKKIIQRIPAAAGILISSCSCSLSLSDLSFFISPFPFFLVFEL